MNSIFKPFLLLPGFPQSNLTTGTTSLFWPILNSSLLTTVLLLSAITVSLLFYVYKSDAIASHQLVDKSLQRMPDHLPIIGNLMILGRNLDEFDSFLSAKFESSGKDKLVNSMPFMFNTIVTISPQDLEHVLSTNFDNYPKGEEFNARLRVLFGDGIFAADGAHWFVERKVASKIFTTRAFKTLFETVFLQKTTLIVDRLNTAAGNNETADMFDLAHRFFMDSFASIAFGVDTDSLSGKDIPFIKAFDRAQVVLTSRFFNPFFTLAEMLNNPKKDFAIVRQFGMNVIKDRRSGVSIGKEGDLLNLFMEYRDDEGNELSDSQMVDNVINFLIAGRDTTAQAISWTLFCLNGRKDILKKLDEEYKEIVGDSDEITYDQVKQMRYHKACFNETLRLYPSVPKNCRVAREDDVLPDGTKISAGTMIGWNPYSMGRSSKLWDNPLVFDPERFLNGKTYSPYQYIAFNAGPRVCLGKSLAELQGVLLLSTLIHRFTLDIVDVGSVKEKLSLTLPMKNGLKMKITPRS